MGCFRKYLNPFMGYNWSLAVLPVVNGKEAEAASTELLRKMLEKHVADVNIDASVLQLYIR